jgi:BirA family biotin operon repressor/biotin-[acetyl-CoA-carboxylase] ligase
MKLHSTAAGVRLIERDTVGSTNAEALALARAGERGPLWLTARRQTAGRGRRGRVWVSELGNLYASLLLTAPAAREKFAELSFVSALAVHDAVARFAGNAELALKWPNDILIDGKKFCGILVEAADDAVVVGIGVNCAHHPADAIYPATDLVSAGVVASPDRLFGELSGTMQARLSQWNRSAGFAAIREDWLKRATGVGGPVRVALPDGEHAGRFETIDQHGRLMLRRPDGALEAIAAGDVFGLSTERQPAAAER